MPKEVKEEELTDGAILSNRSCTDCCCIILFALFIIGWIVVVAVAFAQGNPEQIIRPDNFRGETCGTGRLVNFSNYFVPMPTHYLYGICVAACPSMLDYVCNNDVEGVIGDSTNMQPNTYYDHTKQQYTDGATLAAYCQVNTCTTTQKETVKRYYGLVSKAQENKCFPVIYDSGATLYRCIPFGSDRQNQTLAEQANATISDIVGLADDLGVGSFFSRGFSDTQDAWLVILICCCTGAIFSLIWILLLRWILAPIVYFCIILVFGLLVALGYLAYRMAEDYSKTVLPGDTSSENQLILWRVLQYAAWVLAAMYAIVMLWLLNRIRIAICVMKEASRAFLNNPGLVFIPPFAFVLLMGLTGLFIAATLYIQTIGDFDVNDIKSAAVSVFGAAAVNLTEAAAAVGSAYYDDLVNASNSSAPFNSSQFISAVGTKGLHAYNFFMFLWSANFVICFNFMILAMVICAWYFSASAIEIDQAEHGVEGGRDKGNSAGTLCKAFCSVLRYHLGTIIFGALCIAIIQFVRALFLYIERTYLKKYKDNVTVKLVIWCINCCLAYCERIVKIISKNAFIICCIKSESFFSCAVEALGILTANILRVSMLEYLSTVACFIIKVFIVGCNLVLAYFLMQQKSLTNDVDVGSGLFPIFFILLISFGIASLFVNVYESCVDTILMCFFIDERDMKGRFMPPSLAKLVGMFSHVEEARQKYEEAVKNATNQQFAAGATAEPKTG